MLPKSLTVLTNRGIQFEILLNCTKFVHNCTSRPRYSNTNLRALKRIIKGANRRANYNELKLLWNQATTKKFSRATCHRAAQKLGFKTHKAKEKPLLTKIQKKNRLAWAKEHKLYSSNQWNSIIWSDEARFEVSVGDSRSLEESLLLLTDIGKIFKELSAI
ncbi:uncharacterized protein LOC126737228 [Anthonomus grandis grandis]|uniref:uncharacterized protein LOC126737228 n=1 Tax=Anthonomus grandis grandis TaxID=2921223 RepID=UPI002165089F|nr:uncharacterized protein LOC126737228 [Anthonomus grandis grandis]